MSSKRRAPKARGAPSPAAASTPTKKSRSAPPPAPLPTASAPIDILTDDLLARIVRLIRTRPLLACVSRVCRRWRTAALRAVDSITIRGGGARLPRLAQFPSLTEVKLSHRFAAPLPLPPTVRRLELRQQMRNIDELFPAPLPPLTHVALLTRLVYDTVFDLLRPKDTITSLRFSLDDQPWEYIARMRFPNLAEVSAAFGTYDPELPNESRRAAHFIAAHHSTLRSLTLCLRGRPGYFPGEYVASSLRKLLAQPFPCLASLRLYWHAAPAEALQALLSHCPQLQHLAIDCVGAALATPAALLSSLTKLKLYELDAASVALLPSLPRLRLLSVAADVAQLAAHPPLHPRVTCLALKGDITEAIYATLQQCTALTHLDLSSANVKAAPPASLALPRLAKLKIDAPLKEAAAYIRGFMRAAPRLRSVTVKLDLDERKPSKLPPLPPALLSELQQAGVERLCIQPDGEMLSRELPSFAPLMQHTAAHGCWLEVSLVISGLSSNVTIATARDFAESGKKPIDSHFSDDDDD